MDTCHKCAARRDWSGICFYFFEIFILCIWFFASSFPSLLVWSKGLLVLWHQKQSASGVWCWLLQSILVFFSSFFYFCYLMLLSCKVYCYTIYLSVIVHILNVVLNVFRSLYTNQLTAAFLWWTILEKEKLR